MAAEKNNPYPLGDVEKKLFFHASLQSGALLAGIAIVLLMVLVGWQTGDWTNAIFGFGWLTYIVDRLYLDALWYLWPLIMVLMFILLNFLLKHTIPSYRESTMLQRQGMMGELIRMPRTTIFLAVPFTNVCEEVLFRGAVIGVVVQLCSPLGTMPAAVIALAVSTALFWFAHAQYRDPSSITLALSGGLVLGCAYLVSGSLLVCMITHIIYNWGLIAYEQREMRRDPDYFGGKVPYTIVQDMVNAGKKEPPTPSS